MSAPVTLVIPSWNGRELLGAALESIRAQSRPPARTIVVDNGSADGTAEHLAEEFPWVDVVRLDSNEGFAGAVNAGIRAADTPFVGLVNNDVELDPAWLDRMLDALERDPVAGYVTGKMLSFHDRSIVDDTGTVFTWYAISWNRGKGEADVGQYDAPGYVFGACAGAALYRSDSFASVGLFDEDFFAYAEDTDWAFRAQLRGIRCRYQPEAVSYHMGQATSSRMPGLTMRLGFRNTAYLVLKSYPASELFRNSGRLLYWWWKVLYGSLKDGWFRDFCVAQAQILRSAPRLFSKRRAIQRERVVDIEYLRSVVSDEAPQSHLTTRLSSAFRRLRPSETTQ
jgi:GT2 family glycosyltransferase